MDCNPKLYCNTTAKVCLSALHKGDSCNGDTCDLPFVCNQGKCVEMGSLKEDTKANTKSACASYYLLNDVCIKGPKLERKPADPKVGPIPCPGDKECFYSITNGVIKSSCLRGRTDTGAEFCSVGAGDVPLGDVQRSLMV